MLTLYAKTEATGFNYGRKRGPKDKMPCDVLVYKDKECNDFYFRFPWFYDSKPTKRRRYYTINCVRYRLEWVDEDTNKNKQ